MKGKKRVSRLLLDRYRLNDVSEEQRKLVEAELAADEELRLYYESLEESDDEINRLYPYEDFLALTASRDNAVPADKTSLPKMKETKRVSHLLLERYRLNDLSEEQRKLVEAELAADEELRLYYESLEESDDEINRLYPYEDFLALTAFRDNAVPADKKSPQKMEGIKRVSHLLLERYRLNDLSEEQRKLVEAELAADEELRLYYESLEESDDEINRLYPYEDFLALTAFRDNAVPADKAHPFKARKGRVRRKRLWGFAATAAAGIVFIMYFLITTIIIIGKEYTTSEDNTRVAVFGGNLRAVSFFFSGNVHFGWGNYDRAINDFTRAIELNENYGFAYTYRGNVYYAKGEYDRAIEDYNQAIRLNSTDDAIFNSRGEAYYAIRNYDKAIDDYTHAIDIIPDKTLLYNTRNDKALYHYNRGTAYYFIDEYDLAIDDYTQAIELNPNNPDFYNNRGDVHYDKGEYELAINDYNQAIGLNPDKALFHYNRGFAYYRKAEYDPAIEDYNYVINLYPDEADLYSIRGDVYYAKGEYDLAINDYNQAIGLNPDKALFHYARGFAYYRKAEYDLAIEDYNHVINLYPDEAYLYSSRGDAYYANGEYDRANMDYETSRQLGSGE